jgi:hypothetical protein
MQDKPQAPPPPHQPVSKTAWIVVVLIALCAILPYIFFPLFGIAFVVTTAALVIAAVTVAIFTIGLILLFIFPGPFILLIGIIALIWVILSIFLFPILFPIIMPVFIILMFIAYLRGRNKHLH